MSKTKRKNRSSDEYFRGLIREQNKLIKKLQQRLRYFDKRQHIFDEPEIVETLDQPEIIEMKTPCIQPKCIGFYNILDLDGKIYGTCNSCGYSKRLK